MGRRAKHTYIQMFIAALLITALLVPADPGKILALKMYFHEWMSEKYKRKKLVTPAW